jgi:hypothetical protein
MLLTTSFPARAGCTAGIPGSNEAETTPSTAFTPNGDGTITHKLTGLTWKQCAEGHVFTNFTCPNAELMTWAQALRAANTANAANGGLGFASHNDWRLPNKKELQSIVELCGYSPAINTMAFPDSWSYFAWSATSFPAMPSYAWGLFFSDGQVNVKFKSDAEGTARLVRGGLAVDSFKLPLTPPMSPAILELLLF